MGAPWHAWGPWDSWGPSGPSRRPAGGGARRAGGRRLAAADGRRWRPAGSATQSATFLKQHQTHVFRTPTCSVLQLWAKVRHNYSVRRTLDTAPGL